MITRRMALFAVAALLACDGDTTEPPLPPPGVCDQPGACEVAGVDLLVDSAWMASPQGEWLHRTGYPHWFQNYDSVPIGVRVRNRGDQPSRPTNGYLRAGTSSFLFPVPSLAPGEVLTDTVLVPLSGADDNRGWIPVVDLGREAVDDPFYRNDLYTVADSFYVVGPVLQGTLAATAATVRVGTEAGFAATLANTSPDAILRDSALTFCSGDPAVYGTPDCAGRTPLPRIGPQEQWTGDPAVTVPWGTWRPLSPHAAADRVFALCFNKTSVGLLPRCFARDTVRVLPDVEAACTVRRLVPGESAAGGTPNCRDEIAWWSVYQVWSFQAEAGSTYTATLSGPDAAALKVSIYDYDGELLGGAAGATASAPIATSGRYYVVVDRGFVTVPEFQLVVTAGGT